MMTGPADESAAASSAASRAATSHAAALVLGSRRGLGLEPIMVSAARTGVGYGDVLTLTLIFRPNLVSAMVTIRPGPALALTCPPPPPPPVCDKASGGWRTCARHIELWSGFRLGLGLRLEVGVGSG